MGKSSISEQAKNYAEVIVKQIAGNFTALHDSIKDCDKLNTVRDEYKKAKDQSTFSKFFFDKNIDEYIGYVKSVEEETDRPLCDGYSTIEPLAVGLFGEWGSGKTHQLKLIKQNILYPPKDINFPQITIPIFFNAWRFEKEEHIILPLFETLLNTLEKYERSPIDKAKKISKSTIHHVKNIVTSLPYGLNISSAAKTINGIATGDVEDLAEAGNVIAGDVVKKKAEEKTNDEQVGSQTMQELLKPEELRSIYLNIPQWIEKITLFENVNFVFLIDDLDRCLPENTLKMLESIKLFLDVPSCAFVLAVDDDVVERGVVHHYRDYLSIYHNKGTEDARGMMQHELPITGHEYLEKMIQLPVRLPVIDTVNVRKFLEEHSKDWVEHLPNELSHSSKEHKDITSTLQNKPKDSYERLLNFFEDKIPPKPRKIKRTALLFESKLQLFDGLQIECNDMHILVAKITLLELFAPKLLRFIQNNGYDSIYNRLVEFKKQHESLTEFQNIKEYIERKESTNEDKTEEGEDKKKIENDKNYYTQKEQQVYKRMMHIVEEHYTSRIQFDLDTVFTQNEDKEDLQKIIEMRVKEQVVIKATHELQGNEFLEKLFKEDDVQSWRDAFKVDKLFEAGKATLTDTQLTNIMHRAKQKELHLNHEWRNAVIPYITGEQLRSDKIYFEMSPTTVTKGEFKAFVEATKYKTEAEINKNMYVYDGENWNIKEDASWKKSYIKDETDEHPVVGVSWNDATAYIKWKNETDKKYDYVLPTEDEWYLACNNGKDTKWHFGDDESQLIEYAWYRENSGMKTHKVKTKKPNDLKLYDIHGNVWEWCEDWYDEDKDTKVLRGGSWYYNSYSSESAIRYGNYPSISNNNVGFRLQRTLSL